MVEKREGFGVMEMQTAVKNPHIHMPNNATKFGNSRFQTTILYTLAFFFFLGVGGREEREGSGSEFFLLLTLNHSYP